MMTLELLSITYGLAKLGCFVYAFVLLLRIARSQERAAKALDELVRKSDQSGKA
jgi:hypothetical protein